MYGVEELSNLPCWWCIADGSAAREVRSALHR
ncbi:CbrC family protein [Streptomyces sp. NBC_00320]|nr:hypothetical protein [Streptomyces sp. NBC_00320]MCX5145660.1 CbrC family protein [Streptomyces sp. NBC_00320]